jgi:membrane-associated protease RseP (regulator of RpoE activity)
MNENRTNHPGHGWKWAALLLGGLLVLSMTCTISLLWGGMIGFAMGRVTAPQRFLQQPPFEHFGIEPFPGRPYPLDPFESSGPWLGVYYEMQDTGALVTGVFANSPAEVAGIQTGDLITRVDGRRVSASRSLAEVIEGYRPGDLIELTLLRNGREERLQVRLAARMDMQRPVDPSWNG